MQSTYHAPTFCPISALAFPISSTIFRSAYIRAMVEQSLGGAPYRSRIFSIMLWITVSNALTNSTNVTYVGRLYLWRAWSAVLMKKRPYWQPTPGEEPNFVGHPCNFIILNNLLRIILLNTSVPMSIRFIPLHLFGSERSPILGTVTTCPSCHLMKSSLSSQKFITKSNKWSKFSGVVALKSLGSTFLVLEIYCL